MIFLTVGTQFPFDRLVKAVDNAIEQGVVNEEIFAQIQEGSYKPRNFKYVGSVDKHLFDSLIQKASAIISHAGMGTITVALDYEKPLLVMPRLKRYGEAVNDHQVTIAKNFERLGHLLAADKAEEIPEKIKSLRSFVPKKRKGEANRVSDRIIAFLEELNSHR